MGPPIRSMDDDYIIFSVAIADQATFTDKERMAVAVGMLSPGDIESPSVVQVWTTTEATDVDPDSLPPVSWAPLGGPITGNNCVFGQNVKLSRN